MTFTLPKFGHLEDREAIIRENLRRADIGIPEDVVEQVLAEKDDEGKAPVFEACDGACAGRLLPGAVQTAIREPSEGCPLRAEA